MPTIAMARTILIIDRYVTTRTLIRSFLESELADIQVLEAGGLTAGQESMTRHRVHLVIVNDRLAGLELLVHHPPHDPSARIRMQAVTLLLVTSGGEARAERFRQEGFEHILVSPFSQELLARQVDLICPPRQLRACRRYHIPGAVTRLHWDGRVIPASLLNISRHGLLCEWRLEGCPDLIDEEGGVRDTAPLPLHQWQGVTIDLRLPADWNAPELPPLAARLVGIKVMAWGEDGTPCRVRLCWNFVGEPHAMVLALENKLERQRQATVTSPAAGGQTPKYSG